MTAWRPFVSTLTVEPWGDDGQGRIVTIRHDGCVLATVKLDAEQAVHLAALLLPPAKAEAAS